MKKRPEKPVAKPEKRKPFDPWKSTLEEATAALENGNEKAVFQWQAANDIKKLRPEIESFMQLLAKDKIFARSLSKNDTTGKAILLCVKKVLEHGLIAPDWLSYAFNQRVYPVLHLEVKHWAEGGSFGSTGSDHERRRLKMLIREYILFNYKELRQEHKAKGSIRGYFADFVKEKIEAQPFFKELADQRKGSLKGAGKRTIEEIIKDVKKSPFLKITKTAK